MSKGKETHQTQSVNPEVVNWLECLDAQARTLTPLQDWTSWDDYFLLVRYPHLQPISPPGPDVSVLPPHVAKRLFENSKRVFCEMIADYEEEIAIHDKAKRALEDLTKEQRQQVAALLIDSISSFEIYEGGAKFKKELGRLVLTQSRLRMLERKIEKARKALEELRDYSGKLHWMMRGIIRSMEPPLQRRDSRSVAEHCIKLLEQLELRTPESFREERESFLHSHDPHDPTTFNMVKFYWLFRHGCGLSGHESEIRVALMRNAFWTEWTKPVKYRPRYDTVESGGCTAVRRAVSRFRPDQGTTR